MNDGTEQDVAPDDTDATPDGMGVALMEPPHQRFLLEVGPDVVAQGAYWANGSVAWYWPTHPVQVTAHYGSVADMMTHLESHLAADVKVKLTWLDHADNDYNLGRSDCMSECDA